MFKIIITLLISILLFISQSFATSEKIEQIIKDSDPAVNIGIKVTNLAKNKVMYSLNENRYYIFASALKLITVKTLMDYYGENHQFKTSISQHGNDLYISIHNPDFNTNDLSNMLDDVKSKLGDKQINNFYIVHSSFLLPPEIRTKTISDAMYCYGAPISKVHINKNCTRLIATPTKVGHSLKISAKEIVPYAIDNKAVTIPKNKIDFIRTSIADGKYKISGTLNHETGEVTIGAVSQNGTDHVYYMLKKLLELKGIKINGDIKISFDKLPGKVICEKSKSFKELAAIALKKSDNFITDYFLAEYSTEKRIDEWAKAGVALKDLVKKQYNVDIRNSRIDDGSGISKSNILTINHFDSFLKTMAKKSNFPTLLNIMAIPGEDGTLKNMAYNRPLSKLADVRQVQEVDGAQNRNVLNVHEDLSTGTTPQLSTGVEFKIGLIQEYIPKPALYQALCQ